LDTLSMALLAKGKLRRKDVCLNYKTCRSQAITQFDLFESKGSFQKN